MARIAFGCNLATSFDGGGFAFQNAHQPSSTVDVAAAIAHLDTLTTNVGTAQSTAATAKLATATAKTDALAVQTANVAVTPVENAIALLEADGIAPTQGHVNALRTVWNTLSSDCTAHNIASNNVASTAATADTATGTAKTAADALSTADLVAHFASIVAQDAADVIVDINTTNVTTQNAVRAALRNLEQSISGSGLATG